MDKRSQYQAAICRVIDSHVPPVAPEGLEVFAAKDHDAGHYSLRLACNELLDHRAIPVRGAEA